MRSLASLLAGLIAVAAIVVASQCYGSLSGSSTPTDSVRRRRRCRAPRSAPMADTITNPGSSRAGATARALVAPFAQPNTQSPAFTGLRRSGQSQQHQWLFEDPHRPASTRKARSSTSPTWSVAFAAQTTRHSPSGSGPDPRPRQRPRPGALEAGRYQQSDCAGEASACTGHRRGRDRRGTCALLLVSRRRSAALVWLGLGSVLSAAASFAGSYYFSARADEVASPGRHARRVASRRSTGSSTACTSGVWPSAVSNWRSSSSDSSCGH